jgi:hypothetical protein
MGGFVATTKAASFLEKTISAYKADDQNFDRLKLSTKEWRIGESEKVFRQQTDLHRNSPPHQFFFFSTE